MISLSKQDLERAMVRAQEIRNSSTDAASNAAYDAKVAPVVATYVASETAERSAKADLSVKRSEMLAAVALADKPYLHARAVVSLIVPSLELPGTLKEAPTPTEVMTALQQVQSIVTSHHGEPWADELAAGRFGARVPDAIAKIIAFDTATSTFLDAREARTVAATALYGGLLGLKEVLKHAEGTAGKGYLRLRTRAPRSPKPAAPATEAKATSPTPETPSTTPSPPPTNGSGSAS